MYDYIQSIEEKKLTTQLAWSAVDKKTITKTKQKHALQMSNVIKNIINESSIRKMD